MKALVTIQGASPILLGDLGEEIMRNNEGEVCIPAEDLKCSIVAAGQRFKDAWSKRKSMEKTLEREISVEPENLSFGIKKTMLFKRAAVVGNRSHVILPRPMIVKWELKFELDSGELPMGVVREVLDRAGNHVGVGNFRPDFGRYRVVGFQEQ